MSKSIPIRSKPWDKSQSNPATKVFPRSIPTPQHLTNKKQTEFRQIADSKSKDAENEWKFPERFDYIHGRALLSCFKDQKHVINEAFKSLAPDGYLELRDRVFPFEYIGEPPVHSDLYRRNELCIEGSTQIGRPWMNVINYKRWMQEVGFEDVAEKTFYWPTNAWVKGRYFKQVVAFFQADIPNGIEGMSLKVMGKFG
ncbi:hypothetical protein BDZ45DRAFT_689445 [Acephala macrosclerotiorum]|nr:hypothetical protein BDZ45DRAFT_689445 [Acephala macrosclerotiorum]